MTHFIKKFEKGIQIATSSFIYDDVEFKSGIIITTNTNINLKKRDPIGYNELKSNGFLNQYDHIHRTKYYYVDILWFNSQKESQIWSRIFFYSSGRIRQVVYYKGKEKPNSRNKCNHVCFYDEDITSLSEVKRKDRYLFFDINNQEYGKLLGKMSFKNGKNDGDWFQWYRNGQVCRHCTFKNGDLCKAADGELASHHYDDNGNPISQSEIETDKEGIPSFNPNIKKEREQEAKKREKESQEKNISRIVKIISDIITNDSELNIKSIDFIKHYEKSQHDAESKILIEVLIKTRTLDELLSKFNIDSNEDLVKDIQEKIFKKIQAKINGIISGY